MTRLDVLRPLCATAPAAAFALLLTAAPAAAQSRIEDSKSSTVFVVGESPAYSCYVAARDLDLSDEALNTCSDAFAYPLNTHDWVAVYANRAILWEARGEYARAIDDLDKAVTRGADDPTVQLNRGSVLLKLERWSEAEASATRALDLGSPRPHLAHFSRAIAREEMGDLRGAYDDYTQAAALAPDWEAPRLELERFQVVSGSNGS